VLPLSHISRTYTGRYAKPITVGDRLKSWLTGEMIKADFHLDPGRNQHPVDAKQSVCPSRTKPTLAWHIRETTMRRTYRSTVQAVTTPSEVASSKPCPQAITSSNSINSSFRASDSTSTNTSNLRACNAILCAPLRIPRTPLALKPGFQRTLSQTSFRTARWSRH
jgi:hypothetical protein